MLEYVITSLVRVRHVTLWVWIDESKH